MADLERQIRSLAERRFEATEAVTFTTYAKQHTQQALPTSVNAQTINRTETIIMNTNELAEPRRRWYTLVAAASIAAIVIVGIALIARDTDPAPPAATATASTVGDTLPPVASVQVELTGADGNAEATQEFKVVTAIYDAFNRGDAIGWTTARNAPDPPPSDLEDPEAQYVAAAHAAGAEYDVLSCNYRGIKDVTGHRYNCQTKMIDAFTTAAGLDFREEFEWTVTEGKTVDASSSFYDQTILRTFMGDLGTWIREERPGTSFTRTEFYNYPEASEVPGVLDLMDEFLENSNKYPLTDG